MMAVFIVFTMMLSKSWAAFFRVSVFKVASPSPRINASTRAVITFISGGMFTLKYGVRSFAEDMASGEDEESIIDGKIAAPVRYDITPARMVDP